MKQSKVNVSFEFFPPKNEGAISSLWNNINRLEPLKPRFISVTYGAGGSTRENTHDLVKQIKKKTNLQPAAHLTCINSTKEEIEFMNSICEEHPDNTLLMVSREITAKGIREKFRHIQANDAELEAFAVHGSTE